VRDKIAASKRKGLWVGGPVPRGYRTDADLTRLSLASRTHQRTLIDILANSVHCGTLLYSGGGGQALSG
jgi:hypothetical protein